MENWIKKIGRTRFILEALLKTVLQMKNRLKKKADFNNIEIGMKGSDKL